MPRLGLYRPSCSEIDTCGLERPQCHPAALPLWPSEYEKRLNRFRKGARWKRVGRRRVSPASYRPSQTATAANSPQCLFPHPPHASPLLHLALASPPGSTYHRHKPLFIQHQTYNTSCPPLLLPKLPPPHPPLAIPRSIMASRHI